MVLNATFNNISVIVQVSFIGGGNQSTQRKAQTCHKSLTNFITKCCIEYTSPWAGFELTKLVVIGTDCTGSCKSNYQTIMTSTAPTDINYRNSYIMDWTWFNYVNAIYTVLAWWLIILLDFKSLAKYVHTKCE